MGDDQSQKNSNGPLRVQDIENMIVANDEQIVAMITEAPGILRFLAHSYIKMTMDRDWHVVHSAVLMNDKRFAENAAGAILNKLDTAMTQSCVITTDVSKMIEYFISQEPGELAELVYDADKETKN